MWKQLSTLLIVNLILVFCDVATAYDITMPLPGRWLTTEGTHHAAVADRAEDVIHAVYAGTWLTYAVISDDEITYETIPGTQGFSGVAAIDKRPCEEPVIAYWENQGATLGFAVRRNGAWETDTIADADFLGDASLPGVAVIAVASLKDDAFAVAVAGYTAVRVYVGKPGAWTVVFDQAWPQDGHPDHQFLRMPSGAVYWLARPGGFADGPVLYQVGAGALTEVADLSGSLDTVLESSHLCWSAFAHASGRPGIVLGNVWESGWEDDDWNDELEKDSWGDPAPSGVGEGLSLASPGRDLDERDYQSGAQLFYSVVDSANPVLRDLPLPENFRRNPNWVSSAALAGDRFMTVFGDGEDIGWMELDADGGTLLAQQIHPRFAEGTIGHNSPPDHYVAGADSRGRPVAMASVGGVLFHMRHDAGTWYGRPLDHTVVARSPSLSVQGLTEEPEIEIVAPGTRYDFTVLDYQGTWTETHRAETMWTRIGPYGPSRAVRDWDGTLWTAGFASPNLFAWNGSEWDEYAVPYNGFENPPRLKRASDGTLWAGGVASKQHGALFLQKSGDEWNAYLTLLVFPFENIVSTVGFDIDAAGGLHAAVVLKTRHSLMYYYRSPSGEWFQEEIDAAFAPEFTSVPSCAVAVGADGDEPSVSCLRRRGTRREWIAALRRDNAWTVSVLSERLNENDGFSEIDAVRTSSSPVHAGFVHGRLMLARVVDNAWVLEEVPGARGSGQVSLAVDDNGELWAAFQSGYGTALLSPAGAPDLSRPFTPGNPHDEIAFDQTTVTGDKDRANPESLWTRVDCGIETDDEIDDDSARCCGI